jgi:hypothetical protein
MKVAVILTNHFRTFPLIKDKIKKTYGENVDYYFSTWDHNHSVDHIYDKLITNPTELVFPFRRWYKFSDIPFLPLDLQNVKATFENFGAKDYAILSTAEYDTWVDQIKGFTYHSWWHRFMRFGSIYCRYKGFELVKKSNINYDIVFFQRMDTLIYDLKTKATPFSSLYLNSNPNFYSHDDLYRELISYDLDNHFAVDRINIDEGYIRVEDAFFYTSLTGIDRVYGDLADKINFIGEHPFFKKDMQYKFIMHTIPGTLLQFAKFKRIRGTNHIFTTIHEPTINSGVDIERFGPTRDFHMNYRAHLKNKIEPTIDIEKYTKNEWAQEFFKPQIEKYGNWFPTGPDWDPIYD